MQIDLEADADAVAAQARQLHDDLDENAQGVAQCKGEERQ